MPAGQRKDPYRNFRYLVEIDGIVQAGFSEATIPDSTQDPIEYREGNEPPTVRKLPGLVKYGNVTLKWGITDSLDLYNWRKLVEQGKVNLDAELQTYVPEFPRKRWPITIRHLVTHTSGIRHYRGNEFASMQRYDDLVSPLAIFSADPLLFEPGTRYSYSTYGFNLVANVVEMRHSII